MAVRPIFIPVNDADALSVTKDIDFLWAPGMAKVQKQKSIRAMHAMAKTHGINNILEISSKSEDELGVALSAFNLKIKTKKLSKEFSVESAFQASKVFENGGPYVDLLEKDSRDAKRDIRLKESGNLVSFKFYNTVWSLLPRTAFYDWLYLSALNQNKKLAENLLQFDAFTDIEFNPVKSINCQARTAALFVSLTKKNMLSDVLKSQEDFLNLLALHYGLSSHSIQQNLI